MIQPCDQGIINTFKAYNRVFLIFINLFLTINFDYILYKFIVRLTQRLR